jgi:DNA invertase Pin-like site-specific DNA recombinase
MKEQAKAAIYARVSARKKGQDPRMQIKELREYCRRRGWNIVGEFIDHGVSGRQDTRPALDRLMQDCRKRLVDAVIVYRYDRFARSLRHLVNALSEFDSLGIHFISLHEGVDTTTPNGRLVFGIFATIAEFEQELIRDRIRSGLELARARGKTLGRPKTVCKLNEEQVTQLKKDHSQGKISLRALARKYNVSLWRAYLLCAKKKASV